MCQNHSTVKNCEIWLFKLWILTKNYVIFFCGVALTHCNYICILVLLTQQITTHISETCRRSLSNKITFINPSSFVGSFQNFRKKMLYHLCLSYSDTHSAVFLYLKQSTPSYVHPVSLFTSSIRIPGKSAWLSDVYRTLQHQISIR